MKSGMMYFNRFTSETKRSPGETNIAMENGHRNSGFSH